MCKKLNNKRINGATLELIMRDVLYGIKDYTCDASRNSQPCQLDILSVKKASPCKRLTAQIIPFRKLKVD